jgi:hypothetical protein
LRGVFLQQGVVFFAIFVSTDPLCVALAIQQRHFTARAIIFHTFALGQSYLLMTVLAADALLHMTILIHCEQDRSDGTRELTRRNSGVIGEAVRTLEEARGRLVLFRRRNSPVGSEGREEKRKGEQQGQGQDQASSTRVERDLGFTGLSSQLSSIASQSATSTAASRP